MTRNPSFKMVLNVPLIALCAFAAAGAAFGQVPPGSESQAPEMIPGGKPVTLIALPEDNFFKLVPPPGANLVKETTTQFQINYLTGGTNYFDDTCTAWPAQAQAAFDYAASVWASNLQSSVPITINACWATSLPSGVLGHSGPRNYFRNFSGAPVSSTWYPVALANAIAGQDLDNSAPDMEMAFSSTFNWYLGTDGNPGTGKYDFVSVVLHEIGHGLGFLGSMSVSSGQGSWGAGTGNPMVYDRFTENASGQSLINTSIFPNPSAALAAQLTGGDLYFDGAKANAANSGARVKIYAPSTWSSGSSYAHLDFNTYRNTANALMIYAIGTAESRHLPGPVTLGIFQDEGWSTGGGGTCSLSKPTLISPTGSVSSTPTYTWNAVSGAEKYILYVTDSSAQGKVQASYTASAVGCSSGTGTCSATPSTSLASGSATFWVQAWASCNGGTYSEWSEGKAFTVGGGGTCSLSKPTLVSPTGSASSTPTYTWNAVSGTEQYLLYVSDTGTQGKIQAWYKASDVGCASGTGTCSVTPSTSLASGSATFWVRAWASCNGGTYSDWSEGKTFTVGGGGGTASGKILQLYPVTGATVGGATSLWAQVQNTGSSAFPSNAIVWFWVSGLSNNWVGSTSISGLSAGGSQWYSYNWTIPSSISSGNYTYYAQLYTGSTAISDWSSGQNFTISGGSSTASAAVLSLYPVTGATAGGSARLYAQVKNTGSSALPGDSVVWFWVSGLASNWVGNASTAGLLAGSTTWYYYDWTIPSSVTSGTYSYYARVYSGNTALSDWSTSQSFTISGGGSGSGFNEQFEGSSAPNWNQESGTWLVSSGYFHANGSGLADSYGTATYKADFANFDYTAILYRTEDSANQYWDSSGVVVRASGGGTAGDPNNGYEFLYHRGGKFSVWKNNNGSTYQLQAWTSSSYINQGDAWNKLRVIANGSSLKFYINDQLVWSGSDSSLTTGHVGFMFYSETGSISDHLWVDYAILSTSAGNVQQDLAKGEKFALDLVNSSSNFTGDKRGEPVNRQ